MYKFKEWARGEIRLRFGFRDGEDHLNVLRYEVATQGNYFISHPHASISLFKNWFCLRPFSVGWQIEKMRIQYGDELDPKEPGELSIHSFANANPEQAWRLTQMVVLHDVSEFNKGVWAKRGFPDGMRISIVTIMHTVRLLMLLRRFVGGWGNGKSRYPC
jgi:hypothetical protein